MKKALVLTGFNPASFTGGIESFTTVLTELLINLGIDVDVTCAADARNDFHLHNGFLGQVYAAGRSLLDLPRERYAFVISNGYYGGGYFPKHLPTFAVFHSTHAGYAEAMRKLVPLSDYLEIRYVIGELLERTSAAGARVIAVSDSVKAELAAYYDIQNVEVVPNPVDTSFFFRLDNRAALRDKHGIAGDKKVGLFVGRWEKSKGREITERVFRKLTGVDWIIAAASGGDTSLPQGPNIVTFSGLDKYDMRELYSLADFMFFPSYYEGFGLAAAEAMACGLPVIGFPVGFLHSLYLRQPFSGLALPSPSGETETIALTAVKLIEILLSDDSLYAEISGKGRDIVRDNFDICLWKDRMRKVLCLN